MEWYWWVVIIAVVALIVWLKILFVPKYLKQPREKQARRDELRQEIARLEKLAGMLAAME
jgi:NADH:ubiquinone oxidoreductase subunit 3 (subunit A)